MWLQYGKKLAMDVGEREMELLRYLGVRANVGQSLLSPSSICWRRFLSSSSSSEFLLSWVFLSDDGNDAQNISGLCDWMIFMHEDTVSKVPLTHHTARLDY